MTGSSTGHPRRHSRSRARAAEPPTTGSAAQDAEPDPEQVARTIALRQLTAAPRSRAQLAEALARRDVPPEIAAKVLDRFEEVGLVDDAEYAALLVRTRHTERGLARRALAQELRRKGIDAETAEGALSAVDADDEEQVARDLVQRRLRSMHDLPRATQERRLLGMLARKGHGGSTAYRVVREVLGASEAEDGFLDELP